MALNQLGMISEKFAIPYLFQIFWMTVMSCEGFPILVKGVQNFGQKIGVLFQNWVLVKFTFLFPLGNNFLTYFAYLMFL